MKKEDKKKHNQFLRDQMNRNWIKIGGTNG